MTFCYYQGLIVKATLREKCPNTEFLLVRIFLYSDQKKLRIWTLFTQCQCSLFLNFFWYSAAPYTKPSQYLHVQSISRHIITICEICSKLTMNTPEWHHWRRSGVLIVSLNRFHTLSWCVHWWLRTSKRWVKIIVHVNWINNCRISIAE